ncbi:MAG: NifB/NifX family molybdenum-iron cluster-binding protein [Candidatus Thermoplasmatota archaeon]|nr:NifB/NifX family molybdenum-iron cluster-binding protein [Candidatus Thermoplasmatota archaeon]
MKIIVTATEKDLNAPVDPRFGRCQYFITVDTETFDFSSQENSQKNAIGGAGVQAAQTVANEKVDAVITGSVGPNAFQTLNVAGVKIFTGAQGTVKDAVKAFKEGSLEEPDSSTVQSHHGMGGRGRSRQR